MGIKGLVIIIILAALVAGGLFIAFRESNKPPLPGQSVESAGEGEGPEVEAAAPVVSGDRAPSGRSGGISAGGGSTASGSPSQPMASSGPRDQRMAHLQSSVTAEEVAQAHRNLDTSTDPLVREKAMHTLVNDREKANRDLFLATLRDKSEDPNTRAQAATGLGLIGAIETVPYLLQAMDDDNVRIRARAYSAFRYLTGVDYGFKADSPREQRLKILESIYQLGPPSWRNPPE